MADFKVVSKFEPMGDQISAIDTLSEGIINGKKHQTLMGVTGSGKTFTVAKTIERVNKPTLVLAHNKILAAQLCSEFKNFFPTMPLSILSATTIIINLKHTFQTPTHISKKMPPSMMR